MSGPHVLRAFNLKRRFQRTVALDGVYLDIAPGEVVALIGRSGCGKSTLLRCLSWLDEPEEGRVEIEGRPFGRAVTPGGVLRRQSPREIAALRPRIGFVFQQFNLWPHMTALENVVRGQVVVLKRPRASSAVPFASASASARCSAATRTNFRGASASASPSPAPWPWTPR